MGNRNEFARLDATAQAELVRNKSVKPIELVDAAIERIEELNPAINAVITRMYDLARETAKAKLPDGPFTGVPFLLKDIDATFGGVLQTEASSFMHDYIAPYDSELVVRHKKAGLIIIAKTNACEFGFTPTTESRLHGPCRNPWNTDYSTGGSSGGAAAAVASGMIPFAHANDGGGSIRIPASCCGVFGLKPTRGRNPYGPDFDKTGMAEGIVQEHCVSRTVRDSAALLDATAGRDLGALHTVAPAERPFAQEVGSDPGRLRIGFTVESPLQGPVQQDCIDAVHDTAKLCESLGHDVSEAKLGIDPELLAGASGAEFTYFIDKMAAEMGRTPTKDQFEPMTWEWYQAGKEDKATDYFRFLAKMRQLQRQFELFMTGYDAWLTPTLTRPPPPLGWFDTDFDEHVARLFEFAPFTLLCNRTGLPAMSVPLVWNASGLPIGTQFVARFGDEATLFRLAAQLEQARPWANRFPPVDEEWTMKHPVISADGHIDFVVLPEDLWERNAPAQLRERMPRVIESDEGRFWTTAEGRRMGLAGGMGSAGRRYVPGQIHRSDRMAEQGFFDDLAKGVMRPTIPEMRVKDQELDGLSGEVIYGILNATNHIQDAEVTESVVHIYNEWLAREFCAKAPDRFAGIGVLTPRGTPESAAQELRHCATLGLKGAELGQVDDMLPLWHPDWNPLWEAADETDLPLHVHTAGAVTLSDRKWMTDPNSPHYKPALATVLGGFQIAMLRVVSQFIFGAVLERYPRLRVVIGEAGIGWLPYALERFDFEWEDQFKDLIPRPPSEYWRRQMYATFQVDRTGLKNLDDIGVDTIMWGADFPHPDGTWPDSQALLGPQLKELKPEQTRKILFENAARLYGFPQN